MNECGAGARGSWQGCTCPSQPSICCLACQQCAVGTSDPQSQMCLTTHTRQTCKACLSASLLPMHQSHSSAHPPLTRGAVVQELGIGQRLKQEAEGAASDSALHRQGTEAREAHVSPCPVHTPTHGSAIDSYASQHMPDACCRCISWLEVLPDVWVQGGGADQHSG